MKLFPDTSPIEFHFTITEANTPLLTALQTHCPKSISLSNQQFKLLCEMGAVWVAEPNANTGKLTRPGRIRRAKKPLAIHTEVSVYLNSQVLNTPVPTPSLIADETDFSVWYKPKGMLSQGSKWGDHTTLHRWIERNRPFETDAQRSCWPVHRLDKATDGIMLIAHTKKRAQQLAKQFEDRQVKKFYQAWVTGNFCEAFPNLPHPLQTPVNNKNAYTEVLGCRFDSTQNRSLLDIKLHTGRKHQIRVHLAEAGFAIIGDRLYGQAGQDSEDLQLTAVKLSLSQEDGQLRCYQLPETLP